MNDLPAEISHESSFLFVTGVARSGTTLLTQCLNHHPKIMCVGDAIDEFFRGFVHFAYFKIKSKKMDPLYPIDNFFFSGDVNVSNFIDCTDFKHEIPTFLRTRILERCIKRGGYFCPEIRIPLKNCKAARFDLLFVEIMKIFFHYYGKPSCGYYGLKVGFCEQMIAPLARTFPNMKFILILRDPRAIVSSNYFSGKCYPVFFNIRDWRKSVFYAWKYRNDPVLKARVIATKYENVVSSPEATLKSLTRFLGLEYSMDMLNINFKSANTSYDVGADVKCVSKDFQSRWRSMLPAYLRSQVEMCCYPEMKMTGYGDYLPLPRDVFHFLLGFFKKTIPYKVLSDWCKKLLPPGIIYSTYWKACQFVLEAKRFQMYKRGSDNLSKIKHFFYDPRYFRDLQNEKTVV